MRWGFKVFKSKILTPVSPISDSLKEEDTFSSGMRITGATSKTPHALRTPGHVEKHSFWPYRLAIQKVSHQSARHRVKDD